MKKRNLKNIRLLNLQARGDSKRTQILKATVSVIARSGTGAVTHRDVAKEAKVALASTTYYFKSKSDLLFSTFEYLAEREIIELNSGVNEIPSRLTAEFAAGWWASMISEDLHKNRDNILAEYEMHLETSRTEAMRNIHRRWGAAALEFFQVCMERMNSPDPETDAAIVLCVISGIQLGVLADPTKKLERDLLGPLFRRLLHALIP